MVKVLVAMDKVLKIYGERNTNTNYLSELVRLNLGVKELPSVVPANIKRYQEKWPGREWLRDLYFMTHYQSTLGWKHAAVDWSKLNGSFLCKEKKLTVVTLTKNPYAWLLSLYKRPYHQYYKKKPEFSEFLSRPWKVVRRDGLKCWSGNPIELWNEKNKSYLGSSSRIAILNLRAEDTLLDPQKIIDSIAHAMNITVQKEFCNVVASTKEGSKDFSYYREYYLGESWRSELKASDIQLINSYLDKELLKKFRYEIID